MKYVNHISRKDATVIWGQRRSAKRSIVHSAKPIGFSHSATSPGRYYQGSSRSGVGAVSPPPPACRRIIILPGSLCLQHGIPLAAISHSLTRAEDGSPATVIGTALALLAVADIGEAAP
jgi:hypothetical protein